MISEKIKKRKHTCWHLWASCFFCAILINNKKQHTFYGTIQWTFLLSLIPISRVVSEKKIINRQHPFWHPWTSFLLCNSKSHPTTDYLDNRCYRELRSYLCHMEWQVGISLMFFFHFIYFLDFKFMSNLLHYKWEICIPNIIQYSWQHTLINAEHLKGSAFNAEVL